MRLPKISIQSIFSKKNLWLNGVLFLLTVASTFIVGISWSISFLYAEIAASSPQFVPSSKIYFRPDVLILSAVYAVVLLGILSGHEMGHYLTCRFYRIDATLPYFIPAPTLIGTMGAFIRIRSPILWKRQLFDIGAAGPLAGFILSVPALVIGISISKVAPITASEGTIFFGEPLLLKFIAFLVFGNIPQGMSIVLHPVAFAGWVGVLVTAMNLFPIGQLDGGHVLYSIMGEKSRKLAGVFISLFLVMAVFFWVGWFVWALLLCFLGLKHSRVFDEQVPLPRGRVLIGVFLLIIFIISFIPDPVQGYSLIDLLGEFSFLK